MDGRRHAYREYASTHLGCYSGSVHRAPVSVLNQLRARSSSWMAPTRGSYTEEGSCRSCAGRIHVGPLAQRKLVRYKERGHHAEESVGSIVTGTDRGCCAGVRI